MEVVQECCARGIEIHNAGVYCSGLLVGGDTYFYSKAAPEMIEKAKSWGVLAEKHGVPLPSVAIAFGLWPTAVKKVVIGWGTPEEVKQSIEWAETPVSDNTSLRLYLTVRSFLARVLRLFTKAKRMNLLSCVRCRCLQNYGKRLKRRGSFQQQWSRRCN